MVVQLPGNPRHLFRSILREISYHHDGLTRALLPKYVRDAFDRSSEALRSLEKDEIAYRDRQIHYRKYGRRMHSLFVRANAGDQKAAMKVLQYTYGRSGKRSRELMEPLLSDEHSPPLVPDDKKTSPPKILPQLVALAAAQTSIVKRIVPVIPETNHFKKPVHPRRQANMKKKTFNDAIPKLMPPMSPLELKRLEGLVTGEIEEPLLARRARPKEKVLVVAGVELGGGEVDEGEVRRQRILENLSSGHHLTPTFRKRLYKTLLGQCPILVQVESAPKIENPKRPQKQAENQGPRWKVVYSLLRGPKPLAVGVEEEFADIPNLMTPVPRGHIKRKGVEDFNA